MGISVMLRAKYAPRWRDEARRAAVRLYAAMSESDIQRKSRRWLEATNAVDVNEHPARLESETSSIMASMSSWRGGFKSSVFIRD